MKRVGARVSPIEGTGVFALENISRGETILFLTGARMSTEGIGALCDSGKMRNDDPFQVSEDAYLALDPLPNSVNHSCDPNGGICGENELIALRDIQPDEEIFYDYSTTVGADMLWETEWYMDCNCGALTCRKRIGNWESLPQQLLEKYEKERVLPNYILAQKENRATKLS